jgi:hypothetical protein
MSASQRVPAEASLETSETVSTAPEVSSSSGWLGRAAADVSSSSASEP